MLHFDETTGEVGSRHLSLILYRGRVLTFQEVAEDLLAQVRERVRNGRGRIRALGADFLAYAIIDAIVDGYFTVLEKLAVHIEDLEDSLTQDPPAETLQAIHALKREIVFLRRSVWPLREILTRLVRDGSPLIADSTVPYLRDVYDHSITIIETTESFRDVVAGLHDTYLSGLSNRMNEVMKVLTVIATIFIPLTFVAGIYGMNFEYMPELRWMYPAVWAGMALLAFLMVVCFRRKRWL